MKRLLLTIVLMSCAASLGAQGLKNVRINEVLVLNEDNYMDDYGHRSSWIEFFNSGYESTDVSSCFIGVTDTAGSEIRYMIPDSDPATKMGPHSYLVFFCEGTDTKGTFYTNFTLDGVAKITLYNSNGREVIDELAIDPAAQTPDVSVGYMSRDGIAEPAVMQLPRTTPNATNETLTAVPKSELFRRRDPSGGVMAVMAMSVVFFALVLILLVLKGFGLVMTGMNKRRQAKPAEESAVAHPKRQPAGEQVQEELAAVALALKLFQEEQHINESTVITINRASRVYSPWSSKIHGITALPERK